MIYRRIKKELTLTHVSALVGTESYQLADRWAVLGARDKEKLRPNQGKIDIPTLLKRRAW